MNILIKTFQNWLKDDPFTQSAAAAYYAIFALPALLIIIMGIAAFFFEQEQVEAEVLGHIGSILGTKTADSIDQIVQETQHDARDIWAMIVGVITLLFGASGMFAQLQNSLNRIWNVEVKKSTGWKAFLRSRLLSFSLILIIGFLLLISLSLTTVLTVFGEWFTAQFSSELTMLLQLLNTGVSFCMVTALFTLIYKILPDAKIYWHDAFLGGVLSTILFTIGEYALNYYFTWAEPQSRFGAAGSVILLMLWISYSCMILLIGAEYIKTYAQEVRGHEVKANHNAKKIE